jgi:hypothetical protein
MPAPIIDTSDFARARDRPKIGNDNPDSTFRIAQRVGALTADAAQGAVFDALFRTQSAFVHGRPMEDMPSTVRIRARVLARQVVEVLLRAG